MKILTLLGSPRLHGNTATVLSQFEQLACALGEVERINIARYTLKGCLGCNHCQRHPEDPSCFQKDDISRMLEKILAADVVIYATPLYMWDSTAQMKTLFDRHYCLSKWKGGKVDRSYVAGKAVALLVTCGDPIENNADLIPVIFDREMEHALLCRVFGHYIVPNCKSPSDFTDEPRLTAEQMIADLAKMMN